MVIESLIFLFSRSGCSTCDLSRTRACAPSRACIPSRAVVSTRVCISTRACVSVDVPVALDNPPCPASPPTYVRRGHVALRHRPRPAAAALHRPRLPVAQHHQSGRLVCGQCRASLYRIMHSRNTNRCVRCQPARCRRHRRCRLPRLWPRPASPETTPSGAPSPALFAPPLSHPPPAFVARGLSDRQ